MIDQHKTLAEKFLKKGFWLYLFSFILAPIGYIIKIIISGDLTVSEVGILYGIISLVVMVSAYNDLGVSESLKHYIPQYADKKEFNKIKTILFLAFFIQIITSILIGIILYFSSTFLAENYFKTLAAKETLQVFAFFFLGLNFFQSISQFFLAVQDTLAHKGSEFLRMIFIMLCVLFIFFGETGNLLQYSYSWLIGLYIGIIAAIIIFTKKYYGNYLKGVKLIKDIKFIKPIMKYASLVVISTSAATLLSQIDMQMIIYMLGTTEAGYYTNYLSIISIPFMLIGPIFAFLFPVISEMYGKNETGKIQVIKNIFSKNFIIIGIIFNVFFFIFSEIIAYTLFGEKFIESGKILQYSILLLVFNFLFQINFNILAGTGKVSERVKIIFIAIIFNFLMNLVLIKTLGIYGAALATGMGWLLIFILSEYYIEEKFRIKIDRKNIFKNIFFVTIYGVIFINTILPYFNDKSRLESLFLLSFCFILWTGMIILSNIKAFNNFLTTIKNIKKS